MYATWCSHRVERLLSKGLAARIRGGAGCSRRPSIHCGPTSSGRDEMAHCPEITVVFDLLNRILTLNPIASLPRALVHEHGGHACWVFGGWFSIYVRSPPSKLPTHGVSQ